MSDIEEIPAPPQPPREVIDLLSSDSEPSPQPRRATVYMDALDFQPLPPQPDAPVAAPAPLRRDGAALDLQAPGIPGEEEAFLHAFAGLDDDIPQEHMRHFIPSYADTELQQRPGASQETRDHEIAMALGNSEAFTADDCLQRVLEIFPDISHEHVIGLFNDFDVEGDYETLPGSARLDNIIEQLVSSESYPKQEKTSQTPKKRKREESQDARDLRQWERVDRDPVPQYTIISMRSMLKAEFPDIPVNFINATLTEQKHFFQAYVRLAHLKDSNDPSIGRGRAPVHLARADTIVLNCGWPSLVEELAAARKKVELNRAERAAGDAIKRAEQENLQRAIEAGETAECQCCFDELPMNRQMHCNGSVAHFTCFTCVESYIKTEVGESRCRVLCTAGCGSGFAQAQLNLLSDKKLLEKLAQLEQEKAIRDAGLDDLEGCPFCDYKAILPPIEEDFEFRCANPECEKVSCRRCKSLSHIPSSCEEYAKSHNLDLRHKIAEAMTAALIRSCNKCQKPFIKEYGCNKMSCPSCGNLQCYVCSESMANYDHFDHNPAVRPGQTLNNGKQKRMCPLYDNVEERHEREVKAAEEEARKQLVEENPDVSPEDLKIEVSDAVQKSTQQRVRAGGAGVPPGFRGAGAFRFGVPAALGGLDGLLDHGDDGEDGDDDIVIGHRARRRLIEARVQQAQRHIQDRQRLQLQQLAQLRRAQQPPAVQPAPALPVPALVPPAYGGFQPGQMHGYIPVHLFAPPLAPGLQNRQAGHAAYPPRPAAPPPPEPAPLPTHNGRPNNRFARLPEFDNLLGGNAFGEAPLARAPRIDAGPPAQPQPPARPAVGRPPGVPRFFHDPFAGVQVPGVFAPGRQQQQQQQRQAGAGIDRREQRQAFQQLEDLRRDYDHRMGRHRH